MAFNLNLRERTTLLIKSMKWVAYLIFPGITTFFKEVGRLDDILCSSSISIYPFLLVSLLYNPWSSLLYSSLNLFYISSLELYILLAIFSILLVASNRIGLFKRTVYASMHTSSMLWASSNTITLSFLCSFFKNSETLGSSK